MNPAKTPKVCAAMGYPYVLSPTGRYVLAHDGIEVFRGTEQEVWKYLHRRCGYSVSHALTYEGWSMRPIE